MKRVLTFAFIFAVLVVFSADIAYANDPPIWYDITTKAGFVDERISFSVHAYDPDGDELTYRALNLPSRSNFNPKTRVFSWIPVTSGTYNVEFTAFDGRTSTKTSARIIVSDLNQDSRFIDDDDNTDKIIFGPPTFVNFNPPLVAAEGQLYTYTVQAAGSNGARVSYRLASFPQGMIIDSNTGVIQWTPNFNQGRDEPYIVKVGISNAQFENQREFKLFVQNVSQTISPPPIRRVDSLPPPNNLNSRQPLAISDIHTEQDGRDIVITWKTNLETVGRVIYDINSQADKKENFNYENATPDSKSIKDHEVKIRGKDLKRGETYYFRVVAKRNGDTIVSNEMTFKSNAEGLALLSSLADFFTNPWLWIIIILFALWFLFKKIVKK